MRGAKEVFCGALLCSALFAQGQSKNAPIPIQILAAKKVFISNVGPDAGVTATFKRLDQPKQPYDRFYTEMKTWDRYELVSSPSGSCLRDRFFGADFRLRPKDHDLRASIQALDR